MPSLKLRFDQYNRPLVSVEVKPSVLLHQQYQAHPPNIVPSSVVNFLIDTAAGECVIEEDVIQAWRLVKNVPVLVNSGAGPQVQAFKYPLSLRLTESGQQDSWYHKTWLVSTVPAGHFCGFAKALIGMDILHSGKINYDGPAGLCVLSWT